MHEIGEGGRVQIQLDSISISKVSRRENFSLTTYNCKFNLWSWICHVDKSEEEIEGYENTRIICKLTISSEEITVPDWYFWWCEGLELGYYGRVWCRKRLWNEFSHEAIGKDGVEERGKMMWLRRWIEKVWMRLSGWIVRWCERLYYSRRRWERERGCVNVAHRKYTRRLTSIIWKRDTKY